MVYLGMTSWGSCHQVKNNLVREVLRLIGMGLRLLMMKLAELGPVEGLM
jgi:hypothetical protein